MPDPAAPTTLDGMLAVLASDYARLAGHPASVGATFDQQVAQARDLALVSGLDLSDPHVAATVVRVSFAMVRVANQILDAELPAAWQSAAQQPLSGRMHDHVKAIALGRLAAGAVGALTLPSTDLPEVDDAG